MKVATCFQLFEFGDVTVSRWQWVQRSWALFGLALMLATWRLWIPQNVYPQVPLLAVAAELPAVCQWMAWVVVLGSLLIAGCLPVINRLPMINRSGHVWLFLAFVMAMVVLILTDQHRLQPWAYQFVIYAIVLAAVRPHRGDCRWGMALLRLLTLSIYLYSALSKFDYQFLHTVGQQFLEVGLGFVGIGVERWPWAVRLLAAAAFPSVELLLVVALAVPRLRSAGVAAAIVLHLGLLLVLGPWGLQHQPGVLLWNAFFVTQALLLFRAGPRRATITAMPEPTAEQTGATDSVSSAGPSPGAERASTGERPILHWLAAGTVLLAMCLPLLEPTGWFDHWPSWGLYSPRNSRVTVEVHRAGVGRLPAELQGYLAPADANTSWVPLEIDRWSLATLSVPIYPQDRFQLGVAESLARRYGLDRTIRVRQLGMSNRLTGVRREQTFVGRQQVVAAAHRFRLNGHPRRIEDDE